MTWRITDPKIGYQRITDTSATQNHALGAIVKANDPTFGQGEFIYLLGVASTIVGSGVCYDDSFQTALQTSGLSTPRPVAIAMSANLAAGYGWYQIGGLAVAAKANTTSFAKAATFDFASGLAIAAATGQILNGALVAAVASAKSDVTTVRVMIDRPHATSDLS